MVGFLLLFCLVCVGEQLLILGVLGKFVLAKETPFVTSTKTSPATVAAAATSGP
jgi:hypothetical protein